MSVKSLKYSCVDAHANITRVITKSSWCPTSASYDCFFATKVSFFNEMRVFSDAKGFDWETIMNGVMSDGRIGISHFQVPGFDGDFGFGGTCFPKDINALMKSLEKVNVDPVVLKAAWQRNLLVRKNRDWEKSKSAVSE